MRTPIDFDYDLWTQDSKCFMRIKRTGEECEINRATLRLLRSEEMRLKREQNPNLGKKVHKPVIQVLSLDYINDEMGMEANWLEDSTDYEEIVITKLRIEEFCKTLTDLQVIVFRKCLIEGMPYLQLANQIGLQEGSIRWSVKNIRKKAKKFF